MIEIFLYFRFLSDVVINMNQEKHIKVSTMMLNGTTEYLVYNVRGLKYFVDVKYLSVPVLLFRLQRDVERLEKTLQVTNPELDKILDELELLEISPGCQ